MDKCAKERSRSHIADRLAAFLPPCSVHHGNASNLGASLERQRSDAQMTCLLTPAIHKGKHGLRGQLPTRDAQMTCLLTPAIHKGKHGLRGQLPTRAAPVTGTLAPAPKTVETLRGSGVDGPPIGVDQEPTAVRVRDPVKRVTVQASALQQVVAQDTPQPRGTSLQATPPTEVVRLNYSHHSEVIRGTRPRRPSRSSGGEDLAAGGPGFLWPQGCRPGTRSGVVVNPELGVCSWP